MSDARSFYGAWAENLITVFRDIDELDIQTPSMMLDDVLKHKAFCLLAALAQIETALAGHPVEDKSGPGRIFLEAQERFIASKRKAAGGAVNAERDVTLFLQKFTMVTNAAKLYATDFRAEGTALLEQCIGAGKGKA